MTEARRIGCPVPPDPAVCPLRSVSADPVPKAFATGASALPAAGLAARERGGPPAAALPAHASGNPPGPARELVRPTGVTAPDSPGTFHKGSRMAAKHKFTAEAISFGAHSGSGFSSSISLRGRFVLNDGAVTVAGYVQLGSGSEAVIWSGSPPDHPHDWRSRPRPGYATESCCAPSRRRR